MRDFMMLHILWSHLQVMLWKVADEQAPPEESADITQFGWEMKEGIPIPVTDQGDPAPPQQTWRKLWRSYRSKNQKV